MINIKQPKDESFPKWMNEVHGANFSLTGTRFHKNSATLRSHLESHISDDLTDNLASLSKHERDRIDSLVDHEDWLHEMIDINKKMATSHKRHFVLVEEAVKHQHTSYTSYCSGSSWPSAPVAATASTTST